MEVHCPSCGNINQVPEEYSGRHIICIKCRKEIVAELSFEYLNKESISKLKSLHPNYADQRSAIDWARHVLCYNGSFVILDSETTGLGNSDEIIQLAVIDPKGTVLFNENIKPTSKKTITKDAAMIHGITMEKLASCKPFCAFADPLKKAIGSKTIISYNAKFDRKMYLRSYKQAGGFFPIGEWDCAMLEYAKLIGEWDEDHGGYRWQSLEGGDHTALGDCQATLELIRSMAQEVKLKKPYEFWIGK